ncbi:MAG: isoprenyl transferase [Bdellovibrionaceae bacterium]|nr:isoprenyl transferase [Pseudobdellovibrionaceae bacterium]
MTNATGAPLKHLAIVMDGNGRWAEKKNKNRLFGHVKGTKVAKQIIEECSRLKIENLTLYAFSTENWHRPRVEVSFLMKLLTKYLHRERENLIKNNIRFECIGQLDRLPGAAIVEINKTVELTKHNTGMKLFFALSYGGRQEIVNAAKLFAKDVQLGMRRTEELTEELFSSYLSTYPTPDPDLVIRTSGEMRLSNFLPWQLVYSEIYFSQILWPDFTVADLHQALHNYNHRERRFGKTSSQILQDRI